MARQRSVFPTREIPHLWAHRTQESARNPQGNLFFSGDTIYSYGSHFAIARHITNKRKQQAVLFNSDRYSNTTSKQQSHVRGAIPSSVPVFEVPSVESANHTDNLQYLQEKLTGLINSAARARSSHSIEWQLNNANELRETILQYAKFFGLRKPKLPAVPEADSKKLAELKAREKKAAAEKAAQHRKETQEREERLAKERAEYEAQLPVYIQEWRDNKRTGIPPAPYYAYHWDNRPEVPTLLRITGSEVETSRGARVPVSHALRGLRIIRSVIAAGQEYVRNGHTLHLGNYPIDKIETNGTLHAGCHVISYEEIQRIAPQLETLEAAAANS